MATVTELENQIEQVKKALRSDKSIKVDGKITSTKRSYKELMAELARLEGELDETNGITAPSGIVYAKRRWRVT